MFTSLECCRINDQNRCCLLLGWLGGEGKVQCSVCLKLLHPRGMKRHLSEVHAESKDLKCPACSGTFRNKSSLDTHRRKCFMPLHADQGKQTLYLLPQLTVKSTYAILGRNNWCEVCDKTVVNFRRHMRDVHNNTEVQCEVCQKVFKNDSSCKKHMRVLHNVYQLVNH